MKIVASNRRARFDYEITDTILAGIMLSGQEVKSCRLGHVDMSGSYVSFQKNVPSLKHLKISAYPFASGLESYEPGQDRQLLITKAEAERLQELSDQKGVTIIPLEVQAGKYIKVLIGIAKGKKLLDKRKVIKDRDVERRMRKGEEV